MHQTDHWNRLVEFLFRRRERHSCRARRRGSQAAAAEVLECRRLLSGNVVASRSGAAITLTSDDGGNTVNVYRLDPMTVEIDGLDGTTINGAATVTLAIPKVKSLTVVLGTGYDTFQIYDLSTTGNINVVGSGPAIGCNIEIFSNSAPMTVGGSIVARLSPQDQSDSLFWVFADDELTVAGSVDVSGSAVQNGFFDPGLDVETLAAGGALTVGGSIIDRLSGSSRIGGSVQSEGGGQLLVQGAVRVSLSGPDSVQNFQIDTSDGFAPDGGSLTVDEAVSVAESSDILAGFLLSTDFSPINFKQGLTITLSGFGADDDEIDTVNGGDLTIGGSVVQSSGGISNTNSLATQFGDIHIGGSLTQTIIGQSAEGNFPDAENRITGSVGDISVAGSITVNNSGPTFQRNIIAMDISSNLTVGRGITFNDSGAVLGTINDVENDSDGNLVVGGGLTINETTSDSTAENSNTVESLVGAGNFVVHGLATIKATNSSPSDNTENLVGNQGASGTFSALGIAFHDTGTQAQENEVVSQGGPVRIGALGVTITGSGAGAHSNLIQASADAGSSLKIAGSVVVTDKTSGPASLEIDGSLIGGSVVVTMPGNGAEIEINNGNGFRNTEIDGFLSAVMTGTGDAIKIAPGNGTGFSPVRVGLGIVVIGNSKAPGTFTFHADNLTTPILVPVFFDLVAV